MQRLVNTGLVFLCLFGFQHVLPTATDLPDSYCPSLPIPLARLSLLISYVLLLSNMYIYIYVYSLMGLHTHTSTYFCSLRSFTRFRQERLNSNNPLAFGPFTPPLVSLSVSCRSSCCWQTWTFVLCLAFVGWKGCPVLFVARKRFPSVAFSCLCPTKCCTWCHFTCRSIRRSIRNCGC